MKIKNSIECWILHGEDEPRVLLLQVPARLDVGGQPLLFDFEHAAIGPAILEFAKLWDRELWDADLRRAFFRGYQRHIPVDWPTWQTAIDALRLRAAAGILPQSKKDHAFEQHAHATLERLSSPQRW